MPRRNEPVANVVRDDKGVRLTVDPMENVIVGSNNIMRYLGIQSHATFYTWVELYGCPCMKRPDGLWMTSMTAIDTWIFLAAEMDLLKRRKSRGGYRAAKKQIAHVEKMFGRDSDQADLMHRSYDAQVAAAEAAAETAENGGVKPSGD